MRKPVIKHILVSILILVSTTAMSAAPNLINYQGQLTDANGNALASDVYDLTFKVYDALTDGNLKWEETHTDIPVVKGFFNVVLGSNTDITPAFSSANTFLEITVDSGAPITPRQQVLSSPYALRATHGVPTGTVVSFLGTSAPEGWLLCNGSAIPADAKYDALKTLVGNNVPDLRGMFLRGINDGRDDGNQDPEDRAVGSFQTDEFKEHRHTGDPHGGAGGDFNVWHGSTAGWEVRQPPRPMGLAGGAETRPKNIGVRYIIKY